MEVHRLLGPGLLEIVYKDALKIEFKNNKIPYHREKEFSIEYKEVILPHKFYADFIVYEDIILELKSVKEISNDHLAQTLNYMKLADTPVGIIANFQNKIISTQKIDKFLN
ncbi:GxxExxY protein [Flavobacterium cheongpyeongense]|nr:GxxExxY protein [Flavobacterium cheongpyeongense]